MIRDRKMYVAPTPFALTQGTAGQRTLILPREHEVDERVEPCGELVRIETARLLVGYQADLRNNTLFPNFIENPSAGREHHFIAYRPAGADGPTVTLKALPGELRFDIDNSEG